MPDTSLNNAVPETAVALDSRARDSRTEDEVAFRVKCYIDHDQTLYAEAVAHILTPRRRRTLVSPETFAVIQAALEKSSTAWKP